MITFAEVKKLAAVHVAEPTLLSMYLAVPLDPAQLRELPARASELLAGRLGDADRERVLAKVAALGKDWLGHGLAIFYCSGTGLSGIYQIPSHPRECAMLGTRPHIRPLLAAIQASPAYWVAVVDRRRAWVLAIDWDGIATVADTAAVTMPSPSFGGWYGLEAHRVHERVVQLSRRHYRATADTLAQLAREGEQPLVIGGHHDVVRQLLGSLPPSVRDMFAGSFAADTHGLTPARVRDLAAPVVSRWAADRVQRLVAGLRVLRPERVATGLDACLTAVNAGAAEILVVPEDALIAGYVCGRCGALATGADECPDWGTAAQPVPDLLEEMIVRTLECDGQAFVVQDTQETTIAKLRYPAAAGA
jgi:hypothetical protein